ncbi:antiviral reverse transcriptase Drt4 [Aeromonas veronii]|uniref:antiviral reverse transcriptase Drt4 n=2 Tax=Aeromonas veronii TaxID=654 RepID=UPI003D20E4DA
MTLEERELYVALTRYNYFPNQKSSIGELPPCINSRQFTPEISDALIAINDARRGGYDLVTYFATRYNNASRELSLIHPRAYCRLARHITDNWHLIRHIKENENSFIKPEEHQDGRIVVMNYEDPIEKTNRVLNNSFGKRYIVSADISSCFDSIYTHAISWGLVGFDFAKTNRGDHHWFNKYDMYQRYCKRNETQGVPIGPAASNIALEVILSNVDSELRNANFLFNRYVDDYTCYCETSEIAHKFILTLSKELKKFKLTLNTQKTVITELPSPAQDSWVTEILSCLPSRLNHAHDEEPKLTASEAVTFLNNSILINKKTPDGSVLKYAIQLIIEHLDLSAPLSVYRAVLSLSWHYPILIPYLDSLIEKAELSNDEIEPDLKKLIEENSALMRSDGICWPLYIMKKNNIMPSSGVVESVLNSKDCVALTILNSMINSEEIVAFAKEVIATDDKYYIDTYWLLIYQLFREGKIDDVSDNMSAFVIMRDRGVNFIPEDIITQAELDSDAVKLKMIFSHFDDE